MPDRQDQRAGDNALNIQAGGNVVINSLTVADVIAITEQTFRANLLDMKGVAQAVFNERSEQILADAVERLSKENPNSIQHAAEPDFQMALLDAAKAYGRTGDEDLEKLLVDILVDRVEKPSRSLVQIVLGEALTVAPRLNAAHIDALTISWLIRYVGFPGVITIADAMKIFSTYFLPCLSAWPISGPSYQHLQYLGCGAVSVLQAGFESTLPTKFPMMYKVHSGAPQVATQNIRTALESSGSPLLHSFAQQWDDSDSKSFLPTSLGIALGHANLRRKTGENLDLSIWIH